jgi:hypothetical protein
MPLIAVDIVVQRLREHGITNGRGAMPLEEVGGNLPREFFLD